MTLGPWDSWTPFPLAPRTRGPLDALVAFVGMGRAYKFGPVKKNAAPVGRLFQDICSYKGRSSTRPLGPGKDVIASLNYPANINRRCQQMGACSSDPDCRSLPDHTNKKQQRVRRRPTLDADLPSLADYFSSRRCTIAATIRTPQAGSTADQ